MNTDGLFSVVRGTVEQLGYEYWGIELSAGKRRTLLRVFIDHPKGITHEDCSSVSHQLSGVLDVEDPIKRSYMLEVSSPGVERPLLEIGHYQAYVGCKARVNCHAPIEGRRKFVGKIESVQERILMLETDDGRVQIPVDGIKRANLVFETTHK